MIVIPAEESASLRGHHVESGGDGSPPPRTLCDSRSVMPGVTEPCTYNSSSLRRGKRLG